MLLLSCNHNSKDARNADMRHIAKTISGSDRMQQVPSNLTEINTENIIEISYSDLYDKMTDLRYIYLDTEEPVGYINQVMIHKNRIIVVDHSIANKIFIFNMDGHLIKIISDRGGGPKEYRSLGYADVHNDEIIVVDRQSLKRLYYTLDGIYIRHEKCLPCRAFASLGDKFILHIDYHQSFTHKATPNLVLSVKDSAVRMALPYRNIQKETTGGALMYNYNGDILFLPAVSDTVYQILTDSTYTARYFVKQKKSIWQKYYNEELVHGEISQLLKQGYTQLGTPEFHDTEKYISFRLVVHDEKLGSLIRSYWYDKDTRQTYKESFPNGYNNDPNFVPPSIGVCGNDYIGAIYPEHIENIMEYHNQQQGTKDSVYFKNEELRKIMLAHPKDPNHIIVLYKMDFNK
jgi:hypothetical protein